jgi:pimeloyl-ACP methyl ester carboxylesterase
MVAAASPMSSDDRQPFEDAERRLFARCGVMGQSRMVRLADPALRVRVLEAGEGAPIVLVHGSGMSASTWGPMLPGLAGRRVIAVDLPGFGLSDPHDYSGRSLRTHAVAQLTSLLDALELERAPFVGTSLGGMWALCLALDAPERVSGVAALGVPALALPGMRGDPFFTAMTVPGLGRLVARLPAPPNAGVARRTMRKVLGPHAADHTPEEFFEVVRQGMRRPSWGRAMWSHLNLAMRAGRPRPENFLREDELRRIQARVVFVWGEDDVYGGPEIGRRAVALMPDARLELIPGGHAPFLDDPGLCARVAMELPA